MITFDAPIPSLAEIARRTVPRYTSYPTAPHFGTGVTDEVYADWLRKAGVSGAAISLYLHIPFCRSICHYCGCATKATRQDEPIRAYAEVLRREIAMVAGELHHGSDGRRPRISHLHWGGGTPNLLPPEDFTQIMQDLHRSFDIGPEAEHAIELDPRHVTPEGATFLARMGVTRASLGVQDLDPTVQEAIGRIQPLEQIEHSVAALRLAGINAINFDLIYGLPLQTPASIRRTAMHAAGLAPSRIALFGYAHVPWFRPHQKMIHEADLPNGDERLELARTARKTIDAFGYEEIGIDHFARPEDDLTVARDNGTLRRNFQGYTVDGADVMIGFGASSIGRMPGGYVQNETATGNWIRTVEAGRLPVARGKAFEGEDLVRGAAIEAILCFFAVDLAAVAARHDRDPDLFVSALDRLAPMVAAGWVTIDGWQIRIIQHRIEIARVVASAFDAYLETGAARHSVAF